MDDEYMFQITLIGGTNSGKSTFIQNYVHGYIYSKDINEYRASANLEFNRKYIDFYKKNIRIDFLDFPGTNQRQNFRKFFLANSVIIFLFYESSNRALFQRAKELFDITKDTLDINEVIYVLINSKYDLYTKAEDNIDNISEEEALEFTSENNMLFAHLSIAEKYANGINELLNKALKEFFKRKNIFW